MIKPFKNFPPLLIIKTAQTYWNLLSRYTPKKSIPYPLFEYSYNQKAMIWIFGKRGRGAMHQTLKNVSFDGRTLKMVLFGF
jgi:hypothetical protein